jgi:hypothetical protein
MFLDVSEQQRTQGVCAAVACLLCLAVKPDQVWPDPFCLRSHRHVIVTIVVVGRSLLLLRVAQGSLHR